MPKKKNEIYRIINDWDDLEARKAQMNKADYLSEIKSLQRRAEKVTSNCDELDGYEKRVGLNLAVFKEIRNEVIGLTAAELLLRTKINFLDQTQ